MSKFGAAARGNYNPIESDKEWYTILKEEFPNIADALTGDPDYPKNPESLPPLTLMIFARDGRLKFSLSNRDLPRSFYGVIKNPNRVLESVEIAIEAQEGEWSGKAATKR